VTTGAAFLGFFRSKLSMVVVVLLIIVPLIWIELLKKETIRSGAPEWAVHVGDFLGVALPVLVSVGIGIAVFRRLGNPVLAMLSVLVVGLLFIWWGSMP